MFQPVLLHIDPVPSYINQYCPLLTKYQPVPPHTDPVSPRTNQYFPLTDPVPSCINQYRPILTSTRQYRPYSDWNQEKLFLQIFSSFFFPVFLLLCKIIISPFKYFPPSSFSAMDLFSFSKYSSVRHSLVDLR